MNNQTNTRLGRQMSERQRLMSDHPRYLTPEITPAAQTRKEQGRKDAPLPVTSNVVRYTPEGSGLDKYTANIPNGMDAIEAFELAVKQKKILGTKIRACSLVVGGLREPNARTQGVHGGYTVAEWTAEHGVVAHPDWKSRVAGLPRQKIVPGLPEITR